MSEPVILKPDALVAAGERHYRIYRILDLATVLAHGSQSGDVKRLTMSKLLPLSHKRNATIKRRGRPGAEAIRQRLHRELGPLPTCGAG